MKWVGGVSKLHKKCRYNPYLFLFIGVVGIFTIQSCSNSLAERTVTDEAIPSWVIKLPHDNQYLYSLGISGPAYYYEDGILKSADAARVELAKTISSHITDITLVVQDNGSNHVADQAYVVEVLKSSTDLVQQWAEIVVYWVDRRGIVPSGQPGATYALGRIPKVMRISKSDTNE